MTQQQILLGKLFRKTKKLLLSLWILLHAISLLLIIWSKVEVDSFTVLLQASLDAKDVRTESNGILKNLLILITNKANDIPAWFYLQNPNVKMITLSSPTKEEREALVKAQTSPASLLEKYICRTVFTIMSILTNLKNSG